jgi:hypothetical protein
MDLVLYLEYIFTNLGAKGNVKLSIEHGKYTISRFEHAKFVHLHFDTRDGQSLFFARRELDSNKWSVLVYKSDPEWEKLLEYAFDKVRSTRDASMETWRAEYPAMGLLE